MVVYRLALEFDAELSADLVALLYRTAETLGLEVERKAAGALAFVGFDVERNPGDAEEA